MKEVEIIETVKRVLISVLGYNQYQIDITRVYSISNFPIIEVSLWQLLFCIEIIEDNNYIEDCIMQWNEVAVKKNIPYFILVVIDGETQKWSAFKSELKKAMQLKSINELHVSKFTPKLNEIHQNCFKYLYEREYLKDNNFLFQLRTNNKLKRLEKGYFFEGDDDSCIISFWSGQDWKSKKPNIYLSITTQGNISLVLRAKDSDKKRKFLAKISGLIGIYYIKEGDNPSSTWVKYFSNNWKKNYIEVLDEFLKTDKEIIDGQIFKEKAKPNNNLDGIGFISLEVFQENLKKVLPYVDKIGTEPVTNVTEVKRPIQLQSVTLSKIAMFDTFSMDLSSRVICIIGDNGTGKTTLLRAIVLGLTSVNESTEIDPEESKYSELQKLLQMNGLDKNGNISYQGNGKVSLEYLMDKKYTNTVLLQKEKNSLDIILSDDPSSDGFVALSDSNYFPNLVIGFTQGGRAQTYKFGTYEKQRGNIGDVSALLFNAKQEHFEELEQWIFDLDGDSAKNKRAKQILDFVFQVVSGVIGFEIKIDKVEHQRKEIWVKIGKDELVQFNLISQGFTKVFAWIGHFIKRLSECNPDMENFKDAPAILIIDEIDTYLHPKWQRNILAFLAETFTNTQFIVTTHSPLVANYLNPQKINGGVALYRLEKGASEPKKFEKIYGRDLSAIFFDWMGVPNRNPEIDKEIDEILHLIGKETKESLKVAREKIAKIQMEEYDEIMAEIKSSLEYAEEHLGG